MTRKFESDGVIDRVKSLHSSVLNQLFNKGRLNRLVENEALNGAVAYSLYELFNQTERYVFSNLKTGADPYKRNLQRLYIKKMKDLLEEDANDVVISDIKAAARGSLYSILQQVKKAKDASTIHGLHQMDLKNRINDIQKAEK